MKANNLLQPEECQRPDDAWLEIDLLDRALISIVGKRQRYQAMAYALEQKVGTTASPAERGATSRMRRTAWAEEERLKPSLVDAIFTIIASDLGSIDAVRRYPAKIDLPNTTST
jgi:isochorismate pyruvate lyase